jgi:hypothetical protein
MEGKLCPSVFPDWPPQNSAAQLSSWLARINHATSVVQLGEARLEEHLKMLTLGRRRHQGRWLRPVL